MFSSSLGAQSDAPWKVLRYPWPWMRKQKANVVGWWRQVWPSAASLLNVNSKLSWRTAFLLVGPRKVLWAEFVGELHFRKDCDKLKEVIMWPSPKRGGSREGGHRCLEEGWDIFCGQGEDWESLGRWVVTSHKDFWAIRRDWKSIWQGQSCS